MAATAATAMAVSLLLPWYSKSFFAGGRAVGDNLSAFGVFTFVEAAVLLVAGGVLYLMYSRSQRRPFHLPGGDGTVVFAAGVWALLLLTWRLFDKPDVDDPGATVGIEWGFLVAFAAAGALAAAGARLRAAHVPEPPNPAETEVTEPRPRRRPADPSAVTEVLSEPPAWKGEPPEPPERAKPAQPKPPPPPDRLF